MEKITTRILLVFSIFLNFQAQAYSTISEDILSAFITSPLDMIPAGIVPNTGKINLLKWNENPQDPPAPTERYNRLLHFGRWITLSQNSEDCVDVRNRVLMRESQVPVQMRSANPCKVGTGSWYDPYTHNTFQKSEDVQIDHFVPLKDTYTNGAWRWNYQTRCTFGNYMGFRDHLKPVSGPENMLKSDRNPSDYMPPNTRYKCEYLKTWLSIKLIWKLGMQRAEAQAIKQLITQENCDPADFSFSTSELQNQRSLIQQMIPICPQIPPTQNDDHN